MAHSDITTNDITTFGYRRIVLLLVSLVIVPTGLLLAVGVILLFRGEAALNVLMGILVLALSGAAVTGVILVWVFVRREANLSQLQSDFVSKVSHELRTPLTSIRLFSETLALRREDAKAVDTCITGLNREGARLQDLIDRLLDWGRMESGRRQYHMETTEVSAIVQRATVAFEGVRERQNARLTVTLAEQLPPLWAESASISDALLNLLTNASKYGGRPAEIALRVSAARGELRIAVQDNGIGIPRREHKRIFQKFYRIDDRLSRELQGSGLGLAIAKHVVKAHGGRIEVESALGKGSVFTIVLPVLRPEQAPVTLARTSRA
jgi:two-component system, OmpR family, phosphate regulon sensor histidine kinase PhoR